ncbi:MAG TPA: macro domain-containing protein [Streptosporangiaceae bacterium]|nr:macro domain-containing protein [Streptosporangiaceae bacterium]
MAARRRGHLLVVKETYQNGLVATALAGLGGLGTVVGVVGLISPKLVSDIPIYVWLIFLVAVVLGSFVIRIPRTTGRFAFEPGPWAVELAVGDLFDQGSGIVVTADRRLSLGLDQTGPDSLISQLAERWFEHDRAKLREELAIAPPGPGDADLPLGTTIRFSSPGGYYGWLFCLSTRTTDGSRTTWQDLAFSYDALWTAMRRENSSSVVVPVIGAGFARSQLPFNGLLLFLILSFHAASLERPVTKSLKIIVSHEEFDPRAFSAASKLLGYLGYKKA